MDTKALTGEQARQALAAGVDIVANCVRTTLGPQGRNAILQNSKLLGPTVTNDGATIANRITVPERFVNLGCKIVQEVSEVTNDRVGDGTTTALILAQKMVRTSLKNIESGCNHLKLLDGMEQALDSVSEFLEEMTIPVRTREQIRNVAAVSAGSPELGELIAEAYDRVGFSGVVTVEEGKRTCTYVDYVEGLKFDKGYISPQMINTPKLDAAVIENPLIMVTDDRISYIYEAMPALEQVMATGRPLLIIAEDISVDLLGVLLSNAKKKTMTVVVTTAPGYGDRRQAYLEDIAAVTGATVVAEARGLLLEAVAPLHLGGAQRVVVDKKSTTIIGGYGDKEVIKKRAVAVRKEMESLNDGFRREKLEERLGWLEGGIAKIMVGAVTASAAVEERYRLEDAVHSARRAIQGGILPGGGLALFRASEKLKQVHLKDAGEDLGWQLLADVLHTPLRQLITNCGENEAEIMDNLTALPWNHGYNALTGKYGDMFLEGITDAAEVTRQALRNAYSIAKLIIETDGLLVRDNKWLYP